MYCIKILKTCTFHEVHIEEVHSEGLNIDCMLLKHYKKTICDLRDISFGKFSVPQKFYFAKNYFFLDLVIMPIWITALCKGMSRDVMSL